MTNDTQRRFANPNLVTIVLAGLFVLVFFSDPLGVDVPHKGWAMMIILAGIIGDLAEPVIKKVFGQ